MKTHKNFMCSHRRGWGYLTTFVMIGTLLAFAAQSVCARSEKPFQASFITQFTSVVEPPFLHVTVTGQGRATYLGRSTAFTDNQFISLIDGSVTATYTLTSANGDALVLEFAVPAGGSINVEGGVLFSGTYAITGGTGQFDGVMGSGVFGGSAFFLTETDGIGGFQVVGTIARADGSR